MFCGWCSSTISGQSPSRKPSWQFFRDDAHSLGTGGHGPSLNMKPGLKGGEKVVPERRACLLAKRKGKGCFKGKKSGWAIKGLMSTEPYIYSFILNSHGAMGHTGLKTQHVLLSSHLWSFCDIATLWLFKAISSFKKVFFLLNLSDHSTKCQISSSLQSLARQKYRAVENGSFNIYFLHQITFSLFTNELYHIIYITLQCYFHFVSLDIFSMSTCKNVF